MWCYVLYSEAEDAADCFLSKFSTYVQEDCYLGFEILR